MSTAISTRKSIALDLEDYIHRLGLDTGPVAGYMGHADEKGKPHVVLFSLPRNLDGTIRVWGEDFIHIRWATAFHHMPENGYLVFEDKVDAKEFLRLAFITLNWEDACEVPTKE